MLQKHVCLLYTSLPRVYLKIFTVRTGMLSHVDHLTFKKEKRKRKDTYPVIHAI